MNSCSEVLRHDIVFTKKLFELPKTINETELKSLLDEFSFYINNSKNEMEYYFRLLSLFVEARLYHKNFIPKLFDIILKSFSKTKDDIINILEPRNKYGGPKYPIYSYTVLNYIIYPENFRIQKDENIFKLTQLIEHDDLDGLKSFIVNNSSFDINNHIRLNSLFDLRIAVDSSEIKPIDLCCFFCSPQCFKYLILNDCVLTEQTCKWAICGGSIDIIDILVKEDKSFDNMLYQAVKYHQYEIFDWLISNYVCEEVSLVKCLDCLNFTAFAYFINNGASFIDKEEKEELNVDAQLSSDEKDNQFEETDDEFDEVVNLFKEIDDLIAKANKQDLKSQPIREMTVLNVACCAGHAKLTEFILEQTTSFIDQSWKRDTPLQYAAKKGFCEIARILIEKGANIEAKRSVTQRTPLHLAANKGIFPMVQLLVRKGANIEAKDDMENTPLLLAARRNFLDIVKFLIENGANINAKNKVEQTPYDFIKDVI